MTPKHWIILLTALLVISNAYWVFVMIDTGITMTYREASFDLTEKTAEQAVRLANLNLIGMGADEALALIGKDVYDLEPFEKEGCLYAGQVCLRLDDNRVIVGIETANTPP